MTIETFTQSQILSQQWASIHNERVSKYFRPNNQDQSDIAKQRAFLSSLIRIDPTVDSVVEQIRKVMFFNEVCGFAFGNLAPVYGMPMLDYQSAVEFQPQILLRFREREISKIDLPLRKYRLEKNISFRLFKEDIPSTITGLRALANKIKNQFWTGGKAYNYISGTASGTTVYRYKDEAHGYRLAIEASTRDAALNLIKKSLAISGTTFDDSYLSETKFKRESRAKKITILAKSVDKPFKGRFGKLYLFQVEYKQKGIRDKILIDQQGAIGI